MTFDEFVTKNNNQTLDFDGAFGGQCVDLYRFYCREVLNVPQSPPVPSAKNIWDTYLPQYFDRIPNTPNGVPVKGDVMIYGPFGGVYGIDGHVDIFVDGNVNLYNAFSQNFPTGTKCHIQKHDYKGVIGWLHPKSQSINWEQKYNELFSYVKQIKELTIKAGA